jgi:schlafen family protein
MPRVIGPAEISAILRSGDFDRFLDGLEDEHLECKAAPYQLDQERGKMEFAKDVSALANADGGIILIGAQTERETTYQGDVIRRVSCFGRGLVDLTRYQNVISDWVLPSIPGLTIQWHASAANSDEGVVAISVPQEAGGEKPFLVSKVVEAGKIIGSYLGFFERIRDNVPPISPEQLRERLKDGRRFSELDTRLGNIEEMVGKIIADHAPRPPTLSDETVLRRVQRARQDVGYEGKPSFSLVAWPLQSADFPNLFESREVPVVGLLENPPQLRSGGFDLSTRRISSIIEARLRRCLIPEHKLLEVWRDGVLICVVPGDDWHLCWGMHSTAETGLRINNIALTETVYLFCDWVLKIYANASPTPARIKIRIILSDMTINGTPCSLSPYRPNPYNLGDGRNPAPRSEPGVHVEIEADPTNAEPGVIAYELLAFLYAWFGFDAAEMPYVNRDSPPPKIDPAQIR